MAYYDELTTLYNRRAFFEFANRDLQVASRNEDFLTSVLIDLDDFKMINDRYGHPTGDLVLNNFGILLKDNLRNTDIVARFGGEEFICMMIGIKSDQALNIFERIRSNIHISLIEYQGERISYNFSAGIYSIKINQNINLSINTIIKKADNALYQAKDTGKGKCVICDEYSINSKHSKEK